MEYTEFMLKCLRKLPEEKLEELKNEWERKYAGSEVIEYLYWVIYKSRYKKH